MSRPQPLPVDDLYRHCDLGDAAFETTADLPELEQFLGQDRAVEALEFGAGMRAGGYNLFVLGPNGVGKHTLARRFLEERASGEPVPPDRCYVYNFDDANAPRLLTLAPGEGRRLAADLDNLCSELRSAIPAIFESEEYQARLQELQRSFGQRQERAIREIQEEAEQHDIALIMGQSGFTFAPRKDGETLDQESFQQLPKEERDRIEQTVEQLQEKLQKVLQQFPKWRKESQEQLKALNEEMAQVAVGQLIDELRDRYRDNERVVAHLDAIRKDVVDNAGALRQNDGRGEAAEQVLQRYRANVLVDHGESEGAPVVYEDLPSYHHVIGRIEHRVMQGALLTDFSLIKPGALHRANGGYLILDALELLRQPFAWEGLKRALYAREVEIESPEQVYSLMSTVSLQPEAMALDLKVVLLGDRMLYYLLASYDPDFAELFKVEADFEDDLARDGETQQLYARLIATLARREALRPLARGGVARVIEHASRLAEDSERLSMHARSLADLLREADHFAARAGADEVGREHVQAALDGQERRADRLRERMERSIQRDVVHLPTSGEATGQVNGLAVMQLGGHSFGKGSRITATARVGHGQLLDIEREAKLGGNIHSKAVMIIGNYIGARYAADQPLSLHASLAFEQNYGGIEGDSASVAEVCALLSAIAEVPLAQGLAVTGSIDQHGRVQAVGGVNEKIEGFFETCQQRGLDGSHGVLIPRANVAHLMLRRSVRDAVADGRFRIFPLDHVDQALALLSGMEAGARDAGDGAFPEGTFNRRVAERLQRFAQVRRAADRDSDASDDADETGSGPSEDDDGDTRGRG